MAGEQSWKATVESVDKDIKKPIVVYEFGKRVFVEKPK